MNTNSNHDSLRSASSLLRVANKELHRPKEDSVTLCACQSTKNAVMKFLESYLKTKNVKNYSKHSLEDILSECSKVDRGFKSIDISCFECKASGANCEKDYCLDVNKVSEIGRASCR